MRAAAEDAIENYLRRLLSGDQSVISEYFAPDARPAWLQDGHLISTDLAGFAANIRDVWRWGALGAFDGDIRTESVVRADGVAVVFATFQDWSGLNVEAIYALTPRDGAWRILSSFGRSI